MCSRLMRIPKRRQPNWGHPDHDACGTGFITRLSGPPTHEILQYALQALERLTHRGGVDADGASGDGAGLLTSLPLEFFRARAVEKGLLLGEYFGVGMLFVPATRATEARGAVEEAIGRGKLRLAGWRRVPVNPNALGQRAFETMPHGDGRGLSARSNAVDLIRSRAPRQPECGPATLSHRQPGTVYGAGA